MHIYKICKINYWLRKKKWRCPKCCFFYIHNLKQKNLIRMQILRCTEAVEVSLGAGWGTLSCCCVLGSKAGAVGVGEVKMCLVTPDGWGHLGTLFLTQCVVNDRSVIQGDFTSFGIHRRHCVFTPVLFEWDGFLALDRFAVDKEEMTSQHRIQALFLFCTLSVHDPHHTTVD